MIIPLEVEPQSSCAECGSTFTGAKFGGHQKVYCSQECGKAHRAGRAAAKRKAALIERPCPVCDRVFTPTSGRQKNCSRVCGLEVSARARRAQAGSGYHRAYYLGRTYGLTPQQYDDMVAEQAGSCAICGSRPGGRLFVDHDHATGQVRELLCLQCNSALGQLKDDPNLAVAAAAYLIRHQEG